MNHALPVALLSLLASRCSRCLRVHARDARETGDGAARASHASPLALPDSAFHVTKRLRGVDRRPPSPSRFDTRRIGASEADGDGETSASRRFHGAPVDLDLKSADLANVFRLLADVGHVNIVVAGEVTGTITLRLKHVPWDQALDLVARTHGLELHREGNVIVVRASEPQRVSSAIHDDGQPTERCERCHRSDASSSEILDAFLAYVAERKLELYPAQEEAILELLDGKNVILNTPTGSGKSLVAEAAHFDALVSRRALVLHVPDQGARQREVLRAGRARSAPTTSA